MSFKQLSTGCAVAGALVALVACGGSAGSPAAHGSSGVTGTAHTPSASPSPTVTAATVAQLRRIVLQATDLPGWKASPAEPDSGSNDALTKCLGGKNTDADQVATIDSSDFNLDDATISSSASSYKAQSDLDTDVALLKSPKLVPCYKQEFANEIASSMPKGSTVGALSVRFTPGPGSGPANVAGSGSATVPVTAGGQQVTLYIQFVYLTGPLMEAEVDTENAGAPVPAAVLQSAVKAVATRAAASG